MSGPAGVRLGESPWTPGGTPRRPAPGGPSRPALALRSPSFLPGPSATPSYYFGNSRPPKAPPARGDFNEDCAERPEETKDGPGPTLSWTIRRTDLTPANLQSRGDPTTRPRFRRRQGRVPRPTPSRAVRSLVPSPSGSPWSGSRPPPAEPEVDGEGGRAGEGDRGARDDPCGTTGIDRRRRHPGTVEGLPRTPTPVPLPRPKGRDDPAGGLGLRYLQDRNRTPSRRTPEGFGRPDYQRRSFGEVYKINRCLRPKKNSPVSGDVSGPNLHSSNE